MGATTDAKVLVAEEHAEAARQFAMDFDLRTSPDDPDAPAADEATASEEDDGWPRCPQCNARRSTRCPICETAGTDFPRADPEYLVAPGVADDARPVSCGCGSGACGGDKASAPDEAGPAAAEPSEPLEPTPGLMCSVCDEPFVPQFPRLCEWCGHRFPDGYEVAKVVSSEQIPTRAVATILALVALLIAAAVYFMLVL